VLHHPLGNGVVTGATPQNNLVLLEIGNRVNVAFLGCILDMGEKLLVID
jgi:hypothetical protein